MCAKDIGRKRRLADRPAPGFVKETAATEEGECPERHRLSRKADEEVSQQGCYLQWPEETFG